jgi:hypothetical protein
MLEYQCFRTLNEFFLLNFFSMHGQLIYDACDMGHEMIHRVGILHLKSLKNLPGCLQIFIFDFFCALIGDFENIPCLFGMIFCCNFGENIFP